MMNMRAAWASILGCLLLFPGSSSASTPGFGESFDLVIRNPATKQVVKMSVLSAVTGDPATTADPVLVAGTISGFGGPSVPFSTRFALADLQNLRAVEISPTEMNLIGPDNVVRFKVTDLQRDPAIGGRYLNYSGTITGGSAGPVDFVLVNDPAVPVAVVVVIALGALATAGCLLAIKIQSLPCWTTANACIAAGWPPTVTVTEAVYGMQWEPTFEIGCTYACTVSCSPPVSLPAPTVAGTAAPPPTPPSPAKGSTSTGVYDGTGRRLGGTRACDGQIFSTTGLLTRGPTRTRAEERARSSAHQVANDECPTICPAVEEAFTISQSAPTDPPDPDPQGAWSARATGDYYCPKP